MDTAGSTFVEIGAAASHAPRPPSPSPAEGEEDSMRFDEENCSASDEGRLGSVDSDGVTLVPVGALAGSSTVDGD